MVSLTSSSCFTKGGEIATRARASFRYRLSQIIAAALRPLQSSVLATVKDSISAVTRLDYEPADIRIHADSHMDFLRAMACRKEPNTVRWIENTVRAGDVFYDIGANIGAYAMIAAKQAPGQVISHAFEPSFSTYHQLCKNVILNDCQDEVFPHLIPVGQKSGASVFNYQSLASGASLHAVGPTMDWQGKAFQPVYQQRVLVFSLDDLVGHWGFEMPTHIKIDVDGVELDVLRGAHTVLSDHRLRTLLVEVCYDRGDSDAIRSLMSQHGFALTSEAALTPVASNWVFSRHPT
jgi:FkbM family methyltransferase